jgi:hypothetical protein
MKTKHAIAITTILTVLAFMSCDPTYPILISNSKTDTVTIVTETTIHFHADEPLIGYQDLGGPYDHNIIKFKMAPGTSIECGMAIAGIEDEMPFTEFKVYSNNDSLVANSQGQILDLFEKTFWRNLKTPYQLTIK